MVELEYITSEVGKKNLKKNLIKKMLELSLSHLHLKGHICS